MNSKDKEKPRFGAEVAKELDAHDQHHDILDAINLPDDDFAFPDENDSANEQSNFFDPVIEDFKVGLLYEIFSESVCAHSDEARAKFFDASASCTFILRAEEQQIDLFNAGIEDVLEGNFKQQYHGNRPQKTTTLNFENYAEGSLKNATDLLSHIFDYTRVFIYARPDHAVYSEIHQLVDADIELKLTPSILEKSVKKYIDPNFFLPKEIGQQLVKIPLFTLMKIFSKDRSTGQSVMMVRTYLNVGKSDGIAKTKGDFRPENDGPTLDDLHGLGAAGDWGRDLAIDLADWKSGEISWSEVDKGILLFGAPGTGKTTFASALARTCGVKIVMTSYAQWQSKGHLGDYLKAMRASFAEARKKAPCILFIDEFDSAGDRNSGASGNESYDTKAINGLLECLDGSEGRKGVVVIAATNLPSKIDPALRRPGRLDKVIEIPLPDAPAREGILRYHLKNDLEGVDLEPVVSRTSGMAGAWLESLVRNARRTARRARRDLKLEDLLAALPARTPMPAEALARSAVHEAGHAIIAIEYEKEIDYAEVCREVLTDSGEFNGGCVAIIRPPSEIYLRTKSQVLTMVRHLLGGLAAEEIVFGDKGDGGWSDLKEATFWCARMWLSTGQQDQLIFLAEAEVDPVLSTLKSRPDVQKKVESLLQECMSEVKTIIEKRRDNVRKLANTLIERGRLTGDEITQLLKSKTRLRLLKSMQKPEELFEFPEAYYECA
ncbi:AAA family ATPase [Ochrobactrum chromiisoli]|uniref:AAA family ATPase n=1 Tax=Ochrobactrum chromiisoli TaxID=2993941 RepID=A0ABT3QKT5_9HYPH|nr:AAA family ATPase [Ochrobactrum chromiisoli]MCX2696223.1 AAA family ATPase [Ochrobactrum chromiisoli]